MPGMRTLLHTGRGDSARRNPADEPRDATAEARARDEVISILGEFDAAASADLRTRLEACDDGDTVVIDFSHVVRCDDFALATLAQGLTDRVQRHVVLRGLCRRQERILRYFGVGRADADARSD